MRSREYCRISKLMRMRGRRQMRRMIMTIMNRKLKVDNVLEENLLKEMKMLNKLKLKLITSNLLSFYG